MPIRMGSARPVYLDDRGEPVPSEPVYLDESGNPTTATPGLLGQIKGFGTGLLDVGKGLMSSLVPRPISQQELIDPLRQQLQRVQQASGPLAKVGQSVALTAETLTGIPVSDIGSLAGEGQYGRAAGIATGATALALAPLAFGRRTPIVRASAKRPTLAPVEHAAPPTLPQTAAPALGPVQPAATAPTLPPRPLTTPALSAPLRTSTMPDGIVTPQAEPSLGQVTASENRRVFYDTADMAKPIPEVRPMSDRQKFEGIKLDAFPEPVRGPLKQLLVDNAGWEEARGGSVPMARTSALSQHIALDLTKPMPKGRILNAEEQGAAGNALATLQDKVTEFAAREPSLTPMERAQFEEANAGRLAIMQSLWGSLSETGRALNYWKATKRIMASSDAEFIRQAMKAPGIEGDHAKLAAQLTKLGNDPLAQYNWLKNNRRSTLSDSVRAVYYNNLLSGVATHERNLLSNTVNFAFNTASDVLAGRPGHAAASTAGAFDALLNPLVTDPAGRQTLAMPRAFKDFFFTLENGFSADLGVTSKVDFERIPFEFPGGLKNPFNVPSRMLRAADVMGKAIVRNAEKYRAAYDVAKSAGGETPLADRMGEAFTTLPETTLDQIEQVVTRSVFQEDPGAIGQWMIRTQATAGPIGWVVMPFVKIAANITRQGLEVTPLPLLKAGAQQAMGHELTGSAALISRGDRMGELARSRMALGSALLAPMAYVAATDQVTGAGPRDPQQRDEWLTTHAPYSVKNPMTGEWVNYQGWQPVAFPLSVVAGAVEAMRDATEDGQTNPDHATLERIAGQTVARTLQSVVNQSFLSGVSALNAALTDPERSWDRFAQQLAQSAVPFSGLLRGVTQTLDPVVRRPEGIAEGAQAILPGMSQDLPPSLDRFGQPIERKDDPLLRGFSSSQAVTPTEVDTVLYNLGIRPSRPGQTLDDGTGQDASLSRDQRTILAMARGQAMERAAEQEIARPAFEYLAPERQRERLERAMSKALADVTERAKQLHSRGDTLSLDALLPVPY